MTDFWVASCTPQGGIYRYRLSRDGEMEQLQKLPMPSPMYLQCTKDRLWALLRAPFQDSEESGLMTFDLKTEKSNLLSTKGIVACHLAVDGEEVYCANYLSGSIFKAPNRLVTHSGHGIDPQRQTAPHPHSIFFSPDKQFLLCCDLGLDQLFVYDRDLNLRSTAKTPAGAGPRHLVFSADGDFVYCVNEMGGSVSRFAYQKGFLRHLQTVSLLPKDRVKGSAAAIKRWGDRLYVTERSDGIILTLDPALHVLSRTDCHGREPRDFTIVAKGKFALCANQFSNRLSLFQLEDGIPYYLNSVPIDAPLCIVEATQ